MTLSEATFIGCDVDVAASVSEATAGGVVGGRFGSGNVHMGEFIDDISLRAPGLQTLKLGLGGASLPLCVPVAVIVAAAESDEGR